MLLLKHSAHKEVDVIHTGEHLFKISSISLGDPPTSGEVVKGVGFAEVGCIVGATLSVLVVAWKSMVPASSDVQSCQFKTSIFFLIKFCGLILSWFDAVYIHIITYIYIYVVWFDFWLT